MAERLAEVLLAESDDGGGAETASHLVLPGVHHLPEGHRLLVLGQRLQAAPLPICPNLQVVEE
ncbi:MAG TPA: hypothetical protein VF815_09160 [Myxococcaceae bacterium]|jgi:hypothetical protein